MSLSVFLNLEFKSIKFKLHVEDYIEVYIVHVMVYHAKFTIYNYGQLLLSIANRSIHSCPTVVTECEETWEND